MTNNEIFIQFLKHHRVYTLFKYRLGHHNKYGSRESIPKVERALLDSFSWTISNEGHTYWRKLSEKWDKMCKDLNLQGVVYLKEFIDD